MLNIENTEVYGWEAAIRGLRNPMNSWEKSDTDFWLNNGKGVVTITDTGEKTFLGNIGCADYDLMMRMNKAGSEESKYRRMITVTMDVVAPLYWYKEADTYKVGTVCNSCSTMHKIHSKEFTLDDFSHEHLLDDDEELKIYPYMADGYYGGWSSTDCLSVIIDMLNCSRNKYLETKDKGYWWQMIQLLPSSYNQRRTYQMNYEVLSAIYRQRKNHKLDEWHTFCDWIKSLPYSELITGEENDK